MIRFAIHKEHSTFLTSITKVGSGTWVIPEGCYKLDIFLVGGGGGGGGGTPDNEGLDYYVVPGGGGEVTLALLRA